jgi:2-keto-4-pentenoate hydratase/2-oxohepta-3-ene-1,7-dioic acid hydratase in catechol pathway
VNLSHLFNDKSFCVGQNSISHVKLMQKNLKQEKKMLIKTSFFSKKLCCYFGSLVENPGFTTGVYD